MRETFEIYAENFRGFKKIHVDLPKVIFLVGDNSSGKSSIIHLISFVINGLLGETPHLDDNYIQDRYDFFSPYFDNAPVTIALIHKNREGTYGTALTIEKSSELRRPTIVKSTKLAKTGYSKIKSVDNTLEYASSVREQQVNLKRLLYIHKRLKLKTEIDSRTNQIINDVSTHIAYFQRTSTYDRATNVNFLNSLIDSTISLQNIRQIGPIRANAEKFYSFSHKYESSGIHFASVLSQTGNLLTGRTGSFIRRLGKESKLFDTIITSRADENFDRSPIFVKVKINDKEFFLDQVGTGVAQVAPLIAETAFSYNSSNEAVFLIQQPELHLHPRAQAALGGYLYNISRKCPSLVLETHSDFLIDRFRLRQSSGRKNKISASVYFCQKGKMGNSISKIEIGEDGRYINPPNAYRDFFIDESIRTMF